MFHDHSHHDHDEPEPAGPPGLRRLRVGLRFAMAGLVVAAAAFASASVMVGAGQATVITRFGDLSRVLTTPGLAWKLPTPIESVIPVDLRLRTTSTGLQDVGTKDGLRVLVQAYAAWQVPDEPSHIRQFLRAVRNEPDEAARQLRSLVGAALQVTAGSFELADLVNTDPARQRLPAADHHRRRGERRRRHDQPGQREAHADPQAAQAGRSVRFRLVVPVVMMAVAMVAVVVEHAAASGFNRRRRGGPRGRRRSAGRSPGRPRPAGGGPRSPRATWPGPGTNWRSSVPAGRPGRRRGPRPGRR